MKYFFQEIHISINEKLAGLPSFCRLIIFHSLRYCDLKTGKMVLPPLTELAYDFRVCSAPGRKKENISSDTLRNAFKTIKKSVPVFFKFEVENQRIVIEMPFIRELYHNFKSNEEDVAEVDPGSNSRKPFDNIEDSTCSNSQDNDEDFSDPATVTFANGVYNIKNKKNNNIQDKNNNFSKPDIFYSSQTKYSEKFLPSSLNNQTQTHSIFHYNEPYTRPRTLIPDNFYPRASTLEKALERGITDATNLSKIQKFIDFNKAIESKWVDFDYVYLRWLSIPQNQPKQTCGTIDNNASMSCSTKLRNVKNEFRPLSFNKTQQSAEIMSFPLVSIVSKNERIPGKEPSSREQTMDFDEGSYFRSLDKTFENIRNAFYAEIR